MRSPNPKKPAIFLDRDGVLNRDSGYVYRVEDLVVLPGVAAGLKRLADQGFELVVITNQSGVARGFFTLAQVETFHDALRARIVADGGPELSHFYTCPHHPDGTVAPYNVPCVCRKPEPGLLDKAVAELDLDRGRSFFFGDKPSDIHCGANAGVVSIQLAGERYKREESAAAIVSTFEEAVAFVLQNMS